MSFTKALYYPTIDIKNLKWLKDAILFWDEINTIVPYSIDTPYRSRESNLLFDEGILKPIEVAPDNDFIQELTSATLNYLNTNEGYQLLQQGNYLSRLIHRNKPTRKIKELFDIHPAKLPYKIQQMLEGAITDDGWFRVNKNFAMFYMTLLANKICERNSIGLLTDNMFASNLSDLAKLDNKVSFKNDGMFRERGRNTIQSLAQGQLMNLIIQGINIPNNTSLEDVIEFKRKHQDELGHFRTSISQMTKGLPEGLHFEAFKEKIESIYVDEFTPSYNNLKKALKSSGIKWVVNNFMKISFFSTSATSIPMIMSGSPIPQAILAGTGVSVISSLVSYNIEKEEMLRKNPYSYLYAIEENSKKRKRK